MEEYGASDDDGGGGGAKAKEGNGGDDLAYKSVGRDPYLKGMKRKIETDLVWERTDMRCRQNVDDAGRLALADGLQWWPLSAHGIWA